MEQCLDRARADIVAQIFNLAYRRVALGGALGYAERPDFRGAWQNAILRYGRIQFCATPSVVRPFSRIRASCSLRASCRLWLPGLHRFISPQRSSPGGSSIRVSSAARRRRKFPVRHAGSSAIGPSLLRRQTDSSPAIPKTRSPSPPTASPDSIPVSTATFRRATRCGESRRAGSETPSRVRHAVRSPSRTRRR